MERKQLACWNWKEKFHIEDCMWDGPRVHTCPMSPSNKFYAENYEVFYLDHGIENKNYPFFAKK